MGITLDLSAGLNRRFGQKVREKAKAGRYFAPTSKQPPVRPPTSFVRLPKALVAPNPVGRISI